MSNRKKQQMTDFWSERARLFGNDPRANTNDVWLREIEIGYINDVLKSTPYPMVMDFGCANGYSTTRIAKTNPESRFIGIDINDEMLRVAAQRYDPQAVPNLE
jgi:tRNA G46 methylase TrmB